MGNTNHKVAPMLHGFPLSSMVNAPFITLAYIQGGGTQLLIPMYINQCAF